MCFRIALIAPDADTIAKTAGAVVDEWGDEGWKPRYNIAITSKHPLIVRQGAVLHLSPATWGRPSAKGITANTRSDTLLNSDIYSKQLLRKPCIIPASGFYEWKKVGKARYPYHIQRKDKSLLWLAGIYWNDTPYSQFSIITTNANQQMIPLHDRMPLILTTEEFGDWFDSPLQRLHEEHSVELIFTPVSQRVNSVQNDGPDCQTPTVEPPAPPPTFFENE
ncbi:MAG: SOS response-associated peptidase [bacterium]|nr:SOS response-associated peptidase [bacterium]